MLRVFSIFLLSLNGALAFSPVLNRVEPRGAQRGTEVKVELIGDRLFSPEEILFYRPGLKVKSLTKGKDPKKAFAVIEIPADAPLGEYPLRLRCKEGLTHMRTLWVGQFPTVREERSPDGKREFNNTFGKAQKVATNVTVQGVAQREDSDYYRVSCKKGQRLSAEVEGMRLGRIMFDPFVAILDTNGKELSSNDDSPLLGRDCATSIIVPADGDYTVFLRESAYEGSSQAQYRLHIGHFPRPSWHYPPAGKPGEKLAITFHGDPAGPVTQSFTLPKETDNFVAYSSHAGYSSPSGHKIRVSPLNTTTESEPNNSKKLAAPTQNPPSIPLAFHGTLSKDGDTDWFRFRAKKGQNLRIQVFARSLGSPVDSVISVLPAKKGKAIGSNDDLSGGRPDSYLNCKIPKNGEYAISIRDQLHRGGPEFSYRIEITRRNPNLNATLATYDRNDDQKYKKIVIPRGSRLALVPNIGRKDISCAIELQKTSHLPKGLTIQSLPVSKKLTKFPILFEASADSPLAGTLLPLGVRDPKSGLTGPLLEKIDHVKVNNLGTYHSTRQDRVGLAIIDKAPFDITLSVPPVPIVQKGIMNLTVKAKRDKDFDAPIKVTFPFKPPGIGAPNEVEIPKGKNEVTLTLNANGDAPADSWKIHATAASTSKRGEVRLSSKFHDLKVDEPFLNLTLEMAITHPGQDTKMLTKIEHLKPFEGEATLTLHALPHGVKAAPLKITKETKEISVPLTVASDARKGKHRNIFARVNVPLNGHMVPHNLGHGGTLRINRPPTTAKK